MQRMDDRGPEGFSNWVFRNPHSQTMALSTASRAARAARTATLLLLLALSPSVSRADAGPADYGLLAPYRRSGGVLRPPASGPAVVALQNALAGSCFATGEVPLSGNFDSNTSAATSAFQAYVNLTADGEVGPLTMTAFDAALGIAASPSPGLQRITDAQVTPAITAGAVRVLNAYWHSNVGTEVPFAADGQAWIGRIELHFHPFNGPIKPWGYHHGVSVFCFTNSSCVAPPSRPTGSEFMAATAAMSVAQREAAIRSQLLSGNVPSFLLPGSGYYVSLSVIGGGHELTFRVAPDYLAIGTDADFVRIPVAAFTAQAVADHYNASLPTTLMVDLIWAAARVQVAPQPLAPGPNMTGNAYFLHEQALIEAELVAAGSPSRSLLVGGDKKDIVVSNGYVTHPAGVCIYGWHQLSPRGVPIQPLFCGHAAAYADYSHGVRLVDTTVVLDGVPMPLSGVLTDSVLSALLSDEGPILSPRIPVPPGGK